MSFCRIKADPIKAVIRPTMKASGVTSGVDEQRRSGWNRKLPVLTMPAYQGR